MRYWRWPKRGEVFGTEMRLRAKRDKFGGDAARCCTEARFADDPRANGSRLLSLARLRPLDYILFSDSAFSLWFANNVLDCTILRDQVSATNDQHGLRVHPQQQAALGRPRRRGMAEEAERHVPPLVQLQPVCGMVCLAGAATCLTFLRSSFGGDVEMAQDEVSAQLPTKGKTRDH